MSCTEVVSWIIGWCCQIAIIIIEVYYCYKWWGVLGLVIGILGGPIIGFLFPFIYLFMVGFSWLYFGLWIVGIIFMTTAQVCKQLREG